MPGADHADALDGAIGGPVDADAACNERLDGRQVVDHECDLAVASRDIAHLARSQYRFTGPAPPLDDTLGHIARHPWEIVPLEADKLVNLYRNDHEGVDWVMHEVPPIDESQAAHWRRLADLTYALAMAATILSAPLWLQIRVPARLALVYALLSWTAIQLMFWPHPRYHVAVLPVLSIFAASGFVWAVQQARGWLTSQRRVIDANPAARPSPLGE